MLEAAVSVSGAGDIIAVDLRFADIVAEPPAELVHQALYSYVQCSDRERLTHFLYSGDVDSHLDITMMRGDGEPAPVRLRLTERKYDHARLAITVVASSGVLVPSN